MKRYLFRIVLLLVIFIAGNAGAQAQQTVSGKVSDNGGPIPGVNVYEKDATSNGTATDDRGEFSLKLKGKLKVLVFKSVGFLTREVSVGSSSNLKVVLQEDTKGLEEVVVLGYGEKTSKLTNTGATSSITGKEIRQSPTSSLQNSLAGRLPGFFSQQRSGQPGKDGAQFQIRGVSTFSGTSTPLIIVDDIEVTPDQISMLDQNEIESLTILKDAATTAIYGVRGANGVVVIKTRRGEAGKPQITFRQEMGLNSTAFNFETNPAHTTLSLYQEYLVGGYVDPTIQAPKYFSGNNLEHYRLNDDPFNFSSVDWWKTLMRDYSMQNRSNFDISGGTEKTKYFVSLGYFNQGGMYKNFTEDQEYNGDYNFDRYNFRSNLDIDPTKSLHLRFDVSGRFGVTNQPNDGSVPIYAYLWNGQLSPFAYPAYNANGSLGGGPLATDRPNPIAALKYGGYSRDYTNNVSFVGQANQKLDFVTRGLAANLLVSYASDYNFNRSLKRSEIPTYFYEEVSGKYMPVTANLYRLGKLNRTGNYTGAKKIVNVQASLRYNRSFSNHNVSAMALLNQTRIEENAAEPASVRGITGKLGYNFKNKYLLDVTGAYNGSDRFAVSSKKYGLFPSVSLGYNISEEPFFKNNIKFISNLKIRGSYGVVGNDGIGTNIYNYEKTYIPGSGKGYVFGETSNTSNPGIIEPTLGNNNITWETQSDANIGIDLKLFKGKISLTADAFKKRRKDILVQRASVASAFGATLPASNLGIVDNKGYEFELTYRDNAFGNSLSYFVNAQISHAQNKIVFKDDGAVKYPWLGETGKPVGALFGYQDEGLYQSIAEIYTHPTFIGAGLLSSVVLGSIKYKDLNQDGIIDQYDAGYLGTNQPATIAGLSLGFSYKGFDVSTLFQGSFDYIISINRGVVSYTRPQFQSVPYNLGRWTPVTAEKATYPSLRGNNQHSSTYWNYAGDYVRWKNFEVGYRLDKRIAKKLRMSGIRVYANGYNMGLLYSSYPIALDPESISGVINDTNFTDVSEYPQQRIYNFGIQFTL